jgi:hypothetical protein
MSKCLDELPEGPRIPKPSKRRAGVGSNEHTPTETLIESIEAGDDLHGPLRDLAYRWRDEARVYEVMDRSKARQSDPERWRKRRAEIPRLVKSAIKKFGDPARVFGDDAAAAPQPAFSPSAPGPQRSPARAFALTPIDVAALPVRSWLIYGMLLDGAVTVASAVGGIGKSAWSLRLALAVAAGQSWGKWEVKERRRVLVINAEDGPDELRRRAAANFDETLNNESVADGIVGLESDDIVLVRRAAYGNPIERTPLFDEVREIIRREQVGFVVADPLIELSAGLNESDNADMDTLMRALRSIAREFQIPVLVIHHSKKGGDGGQDSSRGASAIVNNSRVACTLGPLDQREAQKLPDGYYCKVAVVKANYSPKGKPHVLEFQSLKLDNGDVMARVAYVDIDIAATEQAREFPHWPDLIEMVRNGRNGEPWRVAPTTPKGERLDAAIIERWRVPAGMAKQLLEQGQACGRLAVEELPTRYKPKVWRVGPTPDAPLLPWETQ